MANVYRGIRMDHISDKIVSIGNIHQEITIIDQFWVIEDPFGEGGDYGGKTFLSNLTIMYIKKSYSYLNIKQDSMNEYTFHTKRKNIGNPSLNDQSNQNKMALKGKIKETILSQYDHFSQLKKSDEKMIHLHESLEKISQEINESFSLLQKMSDNEKIKQINDKLIYLTALYKKINLEYDENLQKELSILHKNWPDIYEKVKEGIDRETLENVLTAYEEFQNGQITANQAVANGMDYMTHKYKLPVDFFNKNAVDHFNKNIHNLS